MKASLLAASVFVAYAVIGCRAPAATSTGESPDGPGGVSGTNAGETSAAAVDASPLEEKAAPAGAPAEAMPGEAATALSQPAASTPAVDTPAETRPGGGPAAADWKPLPIKKVEVTREGTEHVIRVETETPDSGWAVEIRPAGAAASTSGAKEGDWLREFEVVGHPGAASGAGAPEPRTVTRRETITSAVMTIVVQGANGAFLPGLPAPPPPEKKG